MRTSVCVWHWQRVTATASTRIMGNHMAAIDREDVVLRITKEGGGDRYGCWVIILCHDLYACYFTFRCTRQSCGFAPGFLWNGWLFMMHQKRFVYLWVFHSLFHSDTKPLWALASPKRCRFGNWLEQPRSKERNFQRDVSSPALAGQGDVVACDWFCASCKMKIADSQRSKEDGRSI